MKKVFLFIVIAMFAVSCASTPVVTIDSKTIFAVKFVKGDKESDGTCMLHFTKDEQGIILDSKCIGFYSDDAGVYRCEVGVGSDNKPITQKVDVTTSCTLDIAK